MLNGAKLGFVEGEEDLLFDLSQKGPYIEEDRGLETLVIISLFTNKRAVGDEIDEAERDLGGWWGSAVSQDNDEIGSLLWTLERQKLAEQVAEDARDFVLEALQWFVNDGIAESIECETEVEGRETLKILVRINRGEQQPIQFDFNFLWEGQRRGI